MKKYGFTYQAVKAKTSDGYILYMFRITGKEVEGKYERRRTPVLIIPGLYDDAATWL